MNDTTDISTALAEGAALFAPFPFNQTLYDNPYLCTLSTCPLSMAQIRYVPSLPGNAFYLACFFLCLLAQCFLGVRYRTWSFFGAIFGGEVLEVIGYIARIQMHNNIFDSNPFLMYLITITIAAVFFTAAIYLSFSRIILVYGTAHARFKPLTYTIIFISSDFFCLVLQAIGGGIADTAGDPQGQQHGVNIMIAGLACQVTSLVIFGGLVADFYARVKKQGGSAVPTLRSLGISNGKFRAFELALALATVAVLVRSCFRVAELKSGFDGKLANQEIPYMILEGAMMVTVSFALTIMHPGLVFRKAWKKGAVGMTLGNGRVARVPPVQANEHGFGEVGVGMGEVKR